MRKVDRFKKGDVEEGFTTESKISEKYDMSMFNADAYYNFKFIGD